MDQVRHEAIRLAVEACQGFPPQRIMEFAREIEAYLLCADTKDGKPKLLVGDFGSAEVKAESLAS